MSKFFSEKERKCRCGCGLDVQPGFLKALDELREKFGKPMPLTSGARCPAHNAKSGGAENSQHTLGLAADVGTHKMSPLDRYQLVQAAMALGFSIGVNKAFIHVDKRSGDPLIFDY